MCAVIYFVNNCFTNVTEHANWTGERRDLPTQQFLYGGSVNNLHLYYNYNNRLSSIGYDYYYLTTVVNKILEHLTFVKLGFGYICSYTFDLIVNYTPVYRYFVDN